MYCSIKCRNHWNDLLSRFAYPGHQAENASSESYSPLSVTYFAFFFPPFSQHSIASFVKQVQTEVRRREDGKDSADRPP